MNLRFLLLTVLVGTSACAHVHTFNQDMIIDEPGEAIEVTGEKRVWFNANFDSSFIQQTYERFQEKCPDGTIHSVSSRLSSENELFSWRSRVRFTGVCVHPARP